MCPHVLLVRPGTLFPADQVSMDTAVSKETLPRIFPMSASKAFFKWKLTCELKGQASVLCHGPGQVGMDGLPPALVDLCASLEHQQGWTAYFDQGKHGKETGLRDSLGLSDFCSALPLLHVLPDDKCSYYQGLKIYNSEREIHREQ